jgi:hypothetical protein
MTGNEVKLPDDWHKYSDKLHELTYNYLTIERATDAAITAEVDRDLEFALDKVYQDRKKALLAYMTELLTGLMTGGVNDPEYNGRKEEAANIVFEFYVNGWKAVNDKDGAV